jgi:hypothetical protein
MSVLEQGSEAGVVDPCIRATPDLDPHMRQRVDQQLEGILRPTGPKGEDQEWTLFAIGLEALMQQFFEPDPDWNPSPDPASA